MTRVRAWVTLVGLAVALSAGAAGAADMEKAKKIVTEVCQACHGMDGNSQLPENPKLAGQNPDYLAKALRDYKSGARKNAVMGAMAATVKAEDIDSLAAYFGSQPAVLTARH